MLQSMGSQRVQQDWVTEVNWPELKWELTDLNSLLFKRFSRVFSNTTVQKHQFFGAQLSLYSNSPHPYMTTGKTIALPRWTYVGKVMSLLFNMLSQFSSVQFSRSVVSDSLWPHEQQHARSPCPSPTRGVYQNPCPLSWWCHPTISSSVVPFCSCPQSFAASGFFLMHQLFTSGG